MKKFLFVYILITIFSIVFILGCKKNKSTPSHKLLSHITNINGDTLHSYHYSDDQLVRVVNTLTTSTHNEFIYENGKIIKQIFLEPPYITYNYIYQDNTVIPLKEGDTNYRFKFYLNQVGRVTRRIEYYDEMTDSTIHDYIYQNRNVVKKIINNDSLNAITYGYGSHLNPWFISNDYYLYSHYSFNNKLTRNGEPFLDYRYDNEGYVIEKRLLNNELFNLFYHYK